METAVILPDLAFGGVLRDIAYFHTPLAKPMSRPRVQFIAMDTEQAQQFTEHFSLRALTYHRTAECQEAVSRQREECG
jgi:hypothetical protein